MQELAVGEVDGVGAGWEAGGEEADEEGVGVGGVAEGGLGRGGGVLGVGLELLRGVVGGLRLLDLPVCGGGGVPGAFETGECEVPGIDAGGFGAGLLVVD